MNNNGFSSDQERPVDNPISQPYRWYVLGLLTIIFTINIIDRSILSILQEPIKAEFGLTDTQLGALSGLAFAIFYATLAIPIARIADRGFRKAIITTSVFFWSLMTALCGVTQNFIQLLLFRIGVGVGEAGGVPPATSLISDYFPPEQRGTAMSIYSLGGPVGTMLGVFLGGLLTQFYGWRVAFYVIGVLGIVIAPIVYLTLKELPRGYSDRVAGQVPEVIENASTAVVARTIWSLRSFRHLCLGGAAHVFATYAIASWNPSFYIRVHELGTAEVGTFVGLLAGVFGGMGALAGGTIADRLSKRDLRWYMWTPAIAMFAHVPIGLSQYLVASPYVSFAIGAFSAFLTTIYMGPFLATIHSLVTANMRATTQAVILMVLNIFGLSLGPFLVGVISDLFNFRLGLGVDSLRYAMCMAVMFNLWASFHFFLGSRYLKEDMARDRSQDGK